jgi:hypothetical protein
MPLLEFRPAILKPDRAFDLVGQMSILGIILAQDLQENVPRRNIAHIDRPFEASISATANFGRETPA